LDLGHLNFTAYNLEYIITPKIKISLRVYFEVDDEVEFIIFTTKFVELNFG